MNNNHSRDLSSARNKRKGNHAPYKVKNLVDEHGRKLDLELLAGKNGLNHRILVPEAHRPGLGLAGYLKGHVAKRIVIFGKVEIEYLRDLSPSLRISRLKAILTLKTPAAIVARRYKPPHELLEVCEERGIPLFRSSLMTMSLISKLTLLLVDEFAPSLSCHASFVEVFGIGVMIQGESAIGKSEAALGLIERGHRLISDDVVKIKKREEGYLEGYGIELSKYHMEVRGIGIINVANLYGAVCVQEKKSLDIVVKLEVWDDTHFYDRVGIEEKTLSLLGIEVPFHVLPVKPGRDVVLLLETLALNYRLKKMGYHSAREFNAKLIAAIASKEGKR